MNRGPGQQLAEHRVHLVRSFEHELMTRIRNDLQR